MPRNTSLATSHSIAAYTASVSIHKLDVATSNTLLLAVTNFNQWKTFWSLKKNGLSFFLNITILDQSKNNT